MRMARRGSRTSAATGSSGRACSAMISLIANWAAIAVSLTNTVLLFWLGCTILLNAEHRTWGVWISSLGLLTGALFFVSHTVILGRGITAFDASMDFWWHMGFLAVLTLPFVWYIVILWYVGYWDDPQSALHRRQQPW